MAQKTKEKIIEVAEDNKKKNTKKVASKTATTKKNVEKKSAPKKATTKKATAKKPVSKKSTTKKATEKKPISKKATAKKPTSKKVTAKKDIEKEPASKKTTTKKVTKKDPASKKTTTKKTTQKNTSTKKSTQKKSTNKKAKIVSLNSLEYYDLPYRYNQTVVKILAQNPNTLFAYWDVSDKDRENFEKLYGEMFFYNTRPILIVHNLTNNTSFEIDIDDFANNWYIHVNDSKCKYSVELGRRPKYEASQDLPVNYLNIAFSNIIEIPNDRILFFKENDKIYFKNIKTNQITEKTFRKRTHLSKVRRIYKNYNLSENDDRFDFQNPSSQNPTSTVL